jgi:hypothetical protein
MKRRKADLVENIRRIEGYHGQEAVSKCPSMNEQVDLPLNTVQFAGGGAVDGNETVGETP